ncbi:uncharacterized protein LOC124956673 [Vespa velutina]|uniref:uncharacterized protein LOC124956673 n=1 Tax=Vespa velutina TaxID=202808 RepID=UPI001FB4F16E|nr:uncharacterized protein LOC124956673 [Vespa velutina]
MNLTVIPFFLATQFALPEIEIWKYGPEINYQANILTTIVNKGVDEWLRIDLNGAMGCRSINEKSILCRISTMKYSIIDMLNNRNTSEDITIDKRFQIDFNENGVQQMIVEAPFDIEYLGLVYYLATQFNVGVNIGKELITSIPFVKKENCTLGECDTVFNITLKEKDHSPSFSSFSAEENEDEEEVIEKVIEKEDKEEEEKDSISDDPDEIKLTLIGVPKKSTDINLIIDKFRNSKRCTFAKEYMSWLIESDDKSEVISSFSRINVQENESFESFTMTTTKSKISKLVMIYELTKIKLKSINPATGPLPTFSNPFIINFPSDEMIKNNYII